MKDNKVLLIVIAALLALTVAATGVLIFRGAPAGSTAVSEGRILNTISVSSTGEVTVLPDVGYISLGIETQDSDVKAAENENSAIMDDIMKALEDFDIEGHRHQNGGL